MSSFHTYIFLIIIVIKVWLHKDGIIRLSRYSALSSTYWIVSSYDFHVFHRVLCAPDVHDVPHVSCASCGTRHQYCDMSSWTSFAWLYGSYASFLSAYYNHISCLFFFGAHSSRGHSGWCFWGCYYRRRRRSNRSSCNRCSCRNRCSVRRCSGCRRCGRLRIDARQEGQASDQ